VEKTEGASNLEMTKTKTKKTEVNAGWAEYFAIQLTPEEKAAARAELQKDVERARADGVYERIRALHERRVRERAGRAPHAAAGVSMLYDGGPPKKRGKK
jgi:hypothetical protein